MENKTSFHCQQVRDLVAGGSLKALPQDTVAAMESHMASCRDCREFANAIKGFEEALAQAPEKGLEPNPAILENLQKRFAQIQKEGKAPRSVAVTGLWVWIRSNRVFFNVGASLAILVLGIFLGYRIRTNWGFSQQQVVQQQVVAPDTLAKAPDSSKDSTRLAVRPAKNALPTKTVKKDKKRWPGMGHDSSLIRAVNSK